MCISVLLVQYMFVCLRPQLVVFRRGLSRTFTEDTQPLDSIKDIDILTKSYRETLQTAIDRYDEIWLFVAVSSFISCSHLIVVGSMAVGIRA